MAKLLSPFEALDGLEGVYVATRENLRCTAIKLRSGGLCLFSPVRGLGDEAVASLRELGEVEILLAPNHWHNMGLREYAEAFPQASLCASPDASVRLASVTKLRFENLVRLQRALPQNIRIIVPSGLKTGEIWLSIADAPHHVWVVVDAFCGPGGRASQPAHGPGILGTFPKFGLADRTAYVDWLEGQIEADKPTMIIPCHGAILRDVRLPSMIRQLVADRL